MEANNVKAMRDACQKMRDLLMLRGDGKTRCILTWDEFNESQKMLRAALSAPLRNCDVGTASQQAQRFAELCTSHSKDGARGICDDKCPFYGKEYGSDCALHWAQLPYERGIEE